MRATPHKQFRRAVRIALLDRGWSITRLAARIKRPRSSVNTAINVPSKFPRLKDQIKKELL